ncbi:hypothetical protein [Streptomyces bikiniensis]|uniref:hypothetical protein n=1 Tax=Streptomyces bikiniensis TaxID=1896 RepID=UPI00131A53BB|nr:hypothetical protein [Streptomyces bikiniensis]
MADAVTARATTPTTPAAAVTPAAPPARTTEITLDSWMEQLRGSVGDRPFNRIVMPGSHDSGSWSITKNSGTCPYGESADVARKWPALAASMSRTQSGSLTRQLEAGARYFDLRLCKVDGAWYTYHGGPRGGLFFDRTAPDGTVTRGEAGEIAAWVARHPRELVTVKLITAAPPETARADNQEALTLLADALGGGAGHPALADDTLTPTSTYDQFMAAGKHAVLIDARGDSGYRWTWRQSALSYRGSYVEVDKDWQDILEEVFLPGTRQRNYDAVKRRGDEVLGRAPGADADRLFVLQSIIDPTRSIPDAAVVQALGALRLLSPAADNHLLTLSRELNGQLLGKLRQDWNHSDVAENMNIVMTDDVNQNGDGAGAGELQREIVSRNLPVKTTPNTYYHTGLSSSGAWAPATALGGAGDSFRFSGGRQSIAPTPDGDLQVLGIGLDGNVWHTVRYRDGSWQRWNVLPAADNKTPGFKATDVSITAMPGGDTQLVAVGRDGLAHHNIRHADGGWQGWAAMPGPDNGLVRASRAAASGMPDGSTRVVAFGADGAMRLTTRAADGSWKPWTKVPGVGAPEFAGHDLAITAAGREAQIVAVGLDGNIWHNVVRADGGLQGWRTPPGDGTPAMAARAAAVAGTASGESRILAIGADGNVYHSLRRANGTWEPFRPVPVGPGGRPAFPAGTISAALHSDGSAQTLISAR